MVDVEPHALVALGRRAPGSRSRICPLMPRWRDERLLGGAPSPASASGSQRNLPRRAALDDAAAGERRLEVRAVARVPGQRALVEDGDAEHGGAR